MNFREELGAYFGSNTPVIQIVSHEWEVVEGQITKAIRDLGDDREYLKWSPSLHMQFFEKGEPVELSDEQKADFSRLINPLEVLKWYVGDVSSGDKGYDKPSVLHLEDVHMYMDDSRDLMQIVPWLRQAARIHLWSSDRTIILGTTRATYIQEMEKEMPVLDMPLPDSKNLQTVMDDCIEIANEKGLEINVESEEVRSELVKSTMGLTVMEANVAYNKAIYVHKALGIEQIPFILDEKKQIIKRTGILEYIEPGDQEVGGLNKLTDWLKIRKDGFSAEAENYGLEYPRGILLLGFPGCGKSLTAIHTAKTWNYPLLRFDIGRAFGSLVGESERNMRQALKVAEAISPCILWIDEIEKGLSGLESSGQTDGGTSARVLGSFLTWMQEKTAPVFVLATSNNIDRMPPELTRKGRFDEIFFVDLPNHDTRKDIFEIHIRKKPDGSVGPPESYDIDQLAEISSGYTGAEIKQAVEEGMHVSFSQDRALDQGDLVNSLRTTYPMYMTMRETIEKMRLRKGTMYRSAEEGDSEPLPKKRQDSPPLTQREMRRRPRFAED